MQITATNCNFEREPLKQPFGFKGGYVTDVWQTIARLDDAGGMAGLGLGTQGVLWSDAKVFAGQAEAASNSLMFMMTSFALTQAKEIEWETPIDLLDQLLPVTHDYGRRITGRDDLRLTFTLNSLVAVDNAAWQLYCATHKIDRFEEMIPAEFAVALSERQESLATIPLMSYNVPEPQIASALDDGFFFLKIKIGADPAGDGDPDKMLTWDKDRLSEIHALARQRHTCHTETGHIPYYLDANGRYDCKDRLLRLLDHAEKIGALEHILIVEEPFSEELQFDVSDIPVRLAADESAHSDKDAADRIDMGYGAIALKPIAKTMSMSLRIAQIAHERRVPCFCADLTVNPILVDWNKNVAARLARLPGMKIGVLESNGHQNYRNWDRMVGYHPCADAGWVRPEQGLFNLDGDFYARSGGIFMQSDHYGQLVS